MAFLKFLILTAVLAVSIHAKFVWQDDDWPTFQPFRMPVPPTPPFRPFAPFPPFGPGFGQFPNFPSFPNFPNFPPIPLPVVPSPDQIKNVVPGEGQVFQGVAVQSSSGFTQDKDGKWVRTGGTSVLTNDNGNVHEFKQGDSPPDLSVPIRAPTMPKMPDMPKMPKMPDMPQFSHFPKMKPMEPLVFKPIVFEPIKPIPPIDMNKLKTYQPKQGETFVATGSSSFSKSETINGKTKSEGGGSIIINDNGKAEERHVVYQNGDKEE